jgi:hypothetical protein
MTTKQPVWEFIANLGDVNVTQYGGFLIYRDATGVYPPEVELYETSEDETGGTVFRFILEPDSANEWWHSELPEVAQSCGQNVSQYHADLASGDPVRIATVYRDLVGYFGAFEFDQYPLQLTEAEAEERYREIQ